MIYDEIQEIIKNIFAARAKNVSDKVVNVWAKEISMRNFTDLALKDAEKGLMEDDEIDLTLPKVLAIMYRHNDKYRPKVKKIQCEYCEGKGYVYNTLFFNKNGEYDDYTYALKCYHNHKEDACARMNLNEEVHNKTDINDGYVLVFKSIKEKEEYLKKVKANNWHDLWVKQEVKGELKPLYIPKEEELVEENSVIPDVEDIPEDIEIPF